MKKLFYFRSEKQTTLIITATALTTLYTQDIVILFQWTLTVLVVVEVCPLHLITHKT